MNRDTQALIYAVLCIVIVWATMRWWPVRGTKPPKVELPKCCDDESCKEQRELSNEPEHWGDE